MATDCMCCVAPFGAVCVCACTCGCMYVSQCEPPQTHVRGVCVGRVLAVLQFPFLHQKEAACHLHITPSTIWDFDKNE